MNTSNESLEHQEKATPIANGYADQIELIRVGLAEQLETLLSSVGETEIALAVIWLKQSFVPVIFDLVRYKYGWKADKDGELIYIKDLPLNDLIDILKAVERFL